MPRTPWPVVVAATVVAAWLVARIIGRRRIFTRAQRDLAGKAYGSNCIFRRVQWPPGVLLVWVLLQLRSGRYPVEFQIQFRDWTWTAFDLHEPAMWTTALVLAVLSWTGLPMIRSSLRCAEWMEAGHQVPHAGLGTTSIWNLEPCCGNHNRTQSGRWSKTYVVTHGWPWTLPAYLVRDLIGTLILAWLLATSSKNRKRATA